MTSKRRQSSTYSEDLSRYEFIDYTSASNFEKFVTQIEETLYSWGIKDGSCGIFSPEQLSSAKAAIANPTSAEYVRKENLTFGDDLFQITYSYHPSPAEQYPLASDHFYQMGAPDYHPIHRWSGLDRILILKPVQDSIKKKLFGSTATVETSQAKQLVSACAIAFQSATCRLPVFIPVGQARHDLYIGYMVHFNQEGSPLDHTEMRFNMDLAYVSQLSQLDGLKTLFLQKLSIHRENHGKSGEPSDIFVSAVYTYNLKNWFDENWKEWEEVIEREPKRKSSFSDDFESWGDDDPEENLTVDPGQIRPLTFGAYNDPLRSLTLSAVFPLTEEIVFEERYGQMDALTAEHWQISREFAPVHQQRAFLSSLIEQVTESWQEGSRADETGSDSLGLMRNIFSAGNQAMFSSQAISSTSSVSTTGEQITLIKSDEIERVIKALFTPQDEPKSIQYPGLDTTKTLGLKLKSGSSVPYRSFLWNLLFYCLDAVSDSTSSLNSNKKQPTHFLGFFRVIWVEVLRQIRSSWENLEPIPGLNPYLYDRSSLDSNDEDKKVLGIDLRYNILHQKLSMINCCIHRRRQNAPQNGHLEEHNVKAMNRTGNLFDEITDGPKVSKFQTLLERFIEGENDESDLSLFNRPEVEEGEGSDDSDVFVDAVDDSTSSPKSESTSVLQSSGDGGEEEVMVTNPMQESFVSLPNIPITAEELEADEAKIVKDPDAIEGDLRVHPTLRLLKTGSPMHIPITQDPGFMTEDMIIEQAGVFEKLGNSVIATQQRAKLQSAQLYSDMQAFKAANAHACLEDFVRWHSPRDWIVDENGEGHLSARMSEPYNIWQELWKYSKRIPCSRQKPLFNISSEVEKALYFLETISVQEVFSIMLPTLGLITYDTLSTHPIVQYSQIISKMMNKFGKDLIGFGWDNYPNNKTSFKSIISNIRQLESMMCHAISLSRKLPKQYELIDKLLQNDKAIVNEGQERSTVFKLFGNEQGLISEPSYREYMFYSQCKDLTKDNRILPQRQYTIIKDNEIRIMDMQTTDALYF